MKRTPVSAAQDVALSSVVHYWDLFLVGLSRGSAFKLAETSLVSKDFDLVLCFCVALVTVGEGLMVA